MKLNKKLSLLGVVVMTLILTGCGIKTRAYFDDRERVDTVPTGNAGYLVGTPPPDAGKVTKKTRKVFVVEVTREGDDVNQDVEMELESIDLDPEPQVNYQRNDFDTNSTQSDPVVQQRPPVKIPPITDDDFYVTDKDMEEPLAAVEVELVDYVIEKDDTLQKVSKKFYDSFSKWPRIYDANKDVIKDPNFLKPGTTIKIPLEKK